MTLFGIDLSTTDIDLLGIAGTLALVVIGAILVRANTKTIREREEKAKTINSLLTPFNDAIMNIENGELNFINIANSFFDSQNTAIAHAKTIASPRKKKQIEKTWKDYEVFYSQNAKGQVLGMFAHLPEDMGIQQNKAFRGHIENIIKEIKDI